jgi:hypothetical protein
MAGLVPAIDVFLTLEYRKYQDVDACDKPKTRAPRVGAGMTKCKVIPQP